MIPSGIVCGMTAKGSIDCYDTIACVEILFKATSTSMHYMYMHMYIRVHVHIYVHTYVHVYITSLFVSDKKNTNHHGYQWASRVT